MYQTEKLPLSQLEVEIRGMTGNEEDLLMDRKLVRTGKLFDKIIQQCTRRIGDNQNITEEAILDLKSPDRTFLLVRIRQLSFGDIFHMEVTCPDTTCKATSYYDIDLAQRPIIPPPPEEMFTVTLPVSGKKVRFDYLDGHKEMVLFNAKEDLLTQAMALRLVEVEGVPTNRYAFLKWLKELTVRDRVFLRSAMEKTNCGIDTTLELECQECGQIIPVRIEQDPAFFYPKTI